MPSILTFIFNDPLYKSRYILHFQITYGVVRSFECYSVVVRIFFPRVSYRHLTAFSVQQDGQLWCGYSGYRVCPNRPASARLYMSGGDRIGRPTSPGPPVGLRRPPRHASAAAHAEGSTDAPPGGSTAAPAGAADQPSDNAPARAASARGEGATPLSAVDVAPDAPSRT